MAWQSFRLRSTITSANSSQGEGKVGEARAGLDDVFHVDAEQFLILEAVQRLLPPSVIFGSFHDAVELLAECRLRLDEGRITIVLKQRQEMIMLTAEKVLPQKIAGAEQPGQERKRFLVAEKRERLFSGLAFRSPER